MLKYLLKLGIPANAFELWVLHFGYQKSCLVVDIDNKKGVDGSHFNVSDFTEEELNLIIKAGATTVGLGPHRLRVETATMTLLAALMLWSDSQPILTS